MSIAPPPGALNDPALNLNRSTEALFRPFQLKGLDARESDRHGAHDPLAFARRHSRSRRGRILSAASGRRSRADHHRRHLSSIIPRRGSIPRSRDFMATARLTGGGALLIRSMPPVAGFSRSSGTSAWWFRRAFSRSWNSARGPLGIADWRANRRT